MVALSASLRKSAGPKPETSQRSDLNDRENDDPEIAPSEMSRKLPYRGNIEVSGARYEGRRTSRADAGLDADTLGLFDVDVIHQRQETGVDDVNDHQLQSDFSLDGSESVHTEDPHLSPQVKASASLTDVGSNRDETDDLDGLREEAQSEAEGIRQLEAEEKEAVNRLAKAEEEDFRRARAVLKQKEIYDSVVDMRIKLEPLMSLARTFPGGRQRGESVAWNESDDLKNAIKSAEKSLSSLSAVAQELHTLSWPSEDSQNEDERFSQWRNDVLDEWGRTVNEAEGAVPKGGFKAIDTSVSAQMKASQESGKQLLRTRRIKQKISLVGGLELGEGSNDIQYEDGELYRTLLRDIIESGNSVGGGLRYAQLSKSGRVKKKRDTSFAKGKRLKYNVHEKLVGFLAPVPLPDAGPVDEIVASLFGAFRRV